jgi:hypothetical protein
MGRAKVDAGAVIQHRPTNAQGGASNFWAGVGAGELAQRSWKEKTHLRWSILTEEFSLKKSTPIHFIGRQNHPKS